jgi:hypothetical protein
MRERITSRKADDVLPAAFENLIRENVGFPFCSLYIMLPEEVAEVYQHEAGDDNLLVLSFDLPGGAPSQTELAFGKHPLWLNDVDDVSIFPPTSFREVPELAAFADQLAAVAQVCPYPSSAPDLCSKKILQLSICFSFMLQHYCFSTFFNNLALPFESPSVSCSQPTLFCCFFISLTNVFFPHLISHRLEMASKDVSTSKQLHHTTKHCNPEFAFANLKQLRLPSHCLSLVFSLGKMCGYSSFYFNRSAAACLYSCPSFMITLDSFLFNLEIKELSLAPPPHSPYYFLSFAITICPHLSHASLYLFPLPL